MKYGNVFLLVMALLVPLSIAAWAQGPTYHLGRTPTPEEVKAWDIAIGPEGKELPPGRGTVQEGEKIFAKRCAKCHGPTGTEVKFLHGPLVGGIGSLTTLQPLKTIGSYYPYPTTIWDYINRSMPWDQPSSLSPAEVYSVVAFLFYRNGIIKQSDALDATSLPKIEMPNRNGFFPARPEWKPGYWQPYFTPEPIPRVKKP
jgi:S-disulfanyl-L-cysteine oxidoreductase SoxD